MALLLSAKDLGPPGPDIAFGFGLVQAKAALDFLAANKCQGYLAAGAAPKKAAWARRAEALPLPA